MMNAIQSTHVMLSEKEDWEEKEDVGGGGWGRSSGGGGGGGGGGGSSSCCFMQRLLQNIGCEMQSMFLVFCD